MFKIQPIGRCQSGGEQGENNNAEGMGCTQRELQQPCSSIPKDSQFIFII